MRLYEKYLVTEITNQRIKSDGNSVAVSNQKVDRHVDAIIKEIPSYLRKIIDNNQGKHVKQVDLWLWKQARVARMFSMQGNIVKMAIKKLGLK